MLTVVTGSGSLNEPRAVEVAVIEALTGAVLGHRDGGGRIHDQREICKKLIRPRSIDRSSGPVRK